MIHFLFRNPTRQAAIGLMCAGLAYGASLEQAVRQFNQAEKSWNLNGFQTASRTAAEVLEKGQNQPHAAYWLAAAKFHIALYQREHAEINVSKTALDEAVNELKQALLGDPSNAELHAMLGTVLGIQSAKNLLVGMSLGKTIDRHKREALRLGPENPRVLYLLGASQLRTARSDGARETAVNSLRLARRQFQLEQHKRRNPLSPGWGHSQCLQFLGEAYVLLGMPVQATEAYKACLQLQPGNNHAKQALVLLKSK